MLNRKVLHTVVTKILIVFVNHIPQVQDKQRQIIQLQNILRENEDKVNAMNEHLKNVRQELQHTQVHIFVI